MSYEDAEKYGYTNDQVVRVKIGSIKGGIMDTGGRLTDLEANKRDKKVEITDVAISKIPFVKYHEIPEEHFKTLQEIAKEVLRISRDRNNGKEVAITYDLDSPSLAMQGEQYIAVAFGDENSVDPRRDIEIVNLELVMADLETVRRKAACNRLH